MTLTFYQKKGIIEIKLRYIKITYKSIIHIECVVLLIYTGCIREVYS